MKVCGPATGFLWVLIVMGFSEVRTAPAGSEDIEVITEEGQSTRKDRFIAILRISPDQCTTNSLTSTLGTCLPATDCSNGSVKSGTCAKGFGVCCIIQRTCGNTTSYDNTYFVNPGYPSADTGSGQCVINVNRASTDICQVRLDFIDFELSQPNVDGQCLSDFLTVTGGTSTVPMICGSNAGQHMYVDVDPNGGPLKVTVDRNAASTSERKWNIKIDQIPCSSTARAPSGCLQYFTDTSGTIKSFNFQNNIQPDTTAQIADTNYGVCIEMAAGYCGIIWERDTSVGDNGFTISGNANALAPGLVGTPEASSIDPDDCMRDYVIIPGGLDDQGQAADRYCGLGFPTSVTSTQKPFTLFVVTDGNESGDDGDIGFDGGTSSGFSLNYRQTTTC